MATTAAMRAASRLLVGRDFPNPADAIGEHQRIAEVIDRETGLPELLRAAGAVVNESGPETSPSRDSIARLTSELLRAATF